jgi:hypothetical protein
VLITSGIGTQGFDGGFKTTNKTIDLFEESDHAGIRKRNARPYQGLQLHAFVSKFPH